MMNLLIVFAVLAWNVSEVDEPDPEAVKFNDALVRINKQLSADVSGYGQAIGAALNAKPEESADAYAEAKKAHEELLKEAANAKAELKKVKVHPSKSGMEFYQAHQKFLDGQEKVFQKEFAEIVEIVTDKDQKPEDKQTKIRAILTKVKMAEKTELAELLKAQKAFAVEHKLPVD